MKEIFINSGYFGIILTLFAYWIGVCINRRLKLTVFNPILIASAIVILILLWCGIDYGKYKTSTSGMMLLLTPSTICLAVPMYKQYEILKKYKFAVILSIFIGCVCAITSIVLMSMFAGFDMITTKSLMPKSITTAIALGVANEIGGIPTITIMAVILTGIFGAIVGEKVCKIFKITNPVAVGLAHGTSAHAIGTSKALQIGELQGAMSSVAIIIAGLITVFVIPIALYFM